MQELFEDNDEVVILRVIESGKSHFRWLYILLCGRRWRVAEKLQLESDIQGIEKAYQVEAKRLLDSVISQNKDEIAVYSSNC